MDGNQTEKKKHSRINLTSTRSKIILACAIIVCLLGAYWITSVHRNSNTTVVPYKIMTALNETDTQNHVKNIVIYVAEDTISSSSADTLRRLALDIAEKHCTITSCGIEFYNTEQAAKDAYVFDSSYIKSISALLQFNKQHLGVTEASIIHHFIAEYTKQDNTLTTHSLQQNAGRSKPDKTAPANATAQCVDKTYSFSQHRSGSCVLNEGVLLWY